MLVHLFLIVITSKVYAQNGDREHHGPQTCGGILKSPVGTIKTPNFPNAFPVPIKCKWIIEHDIVNGTISVYFTQQYTTSGLTFTEYTYYDDSYKLEERRALTVTEENITKIKWLQVQSPVLVVELNLDRLEGTQLRALGLLSVFGFNMTYAVRGPTDAPGPSSCSAIECRLLGHCYATRDYEEFFCSCFDGYSGADCGSGPLCPKSSNMCKNGGTCRQMGPAAVSCICAPGYTGDLCEAQIAQPECGIDECLDGCKKGTICDCNPKDSDLTSARFDTRLQVVDQPKVNISQEIVKQLTSYLITSNITLDDEIEILNISSVEASGARTVWVRIWSSRQLAGPLRAALARLAATRARTHTLRLLPDTLHFHMQHALSLYSLGVNQRPEIWEGSEFILTCMAYGSPEIDFIWYKNGVKINFDGTTREIWSRTVSEDGLGRRMSVLGISTAQQLDGGVWSCAAVDASKRRCRAITLTIITPPTVTLVPSALTVYKGDNVSVTCLAGAGRAHGVLGFSWARERSLLPMQPDRHVWEDLYPAGSVLKLYNVQKSSEYRCQVTSVAGTNSASVWVWALGNDDEACQSDAAHGTRWARTAPGAHASNACPPGYSGEITRFCEPTTGQHGVKWISPDFSDCVADSLKNIHNQFTLISYGYSWKNVTDISSQYLSVLRSLPIHRGGGVSPLHHTTEMLDYLTSGVAQYEDKQQSIIHLLDIYDYLLQQSDAFLDEEKIYELQNAIAKTASMKSKFSARLPSFSIRSDSGAQLELRHTAATLSTKDWHVTSQSSSEWHISSTNVEVAPASQNLTIVSALYHDLTKRIPSLKTFIQYQMGVEVQYTVCSQQVQISISGVPPEQMLQYSISLTFDHSANYSIDASKLACGLRTTSSPGAWSVTECELCVTRASHATCHCRSPGTVALLTRASHSSTDTEEELRSIVMISVSICGAICVCACALQLLSLTPVSARRRPSMHALLKAITAAGHAAAMFVLPNCDSTQQVACPGTFGWVIAACWSAACAALCAQPLLLHAELAGRGQREHSVGLLAGFCVLTCLCARLWGGAPLQVGSAASNIFTGSAVLLTTLAFSLALTAHKSVRHVANKVPPNRRTYFNLRIHVVCNTLVLLLTTSSANAAAVAYVQLGNQGVAKAAVFSAAALANGVAILVCYVICDEECLRVTRRLLSPPTREWEHRPGAGDTSLNLYIKQAGEVESRGGAMGTVDSCSSPVSPALSYWRARPLDSPATMHRQANPDTRDSRADIIRCVEYKETALPTHACAQTSVCDVIPARAIRQYRDTHTDPACVELCVRDTPTRIKPVLSFAVNFQPYVERRVDTAKETCTICAQSNPDVSKITSPPIKSCLKKNTRGFTSSTSMPSIDTIKDDTKPHIQKINNEWNKTYDNKQTDKVLNKISNDLDFLLNRTQGDSPHIQGAPT